MKLIAGISSAALLCLLSLNGGAQQSASVSAFVPAAPPSTAVRTILPSNNAIANAMRYETSLNAEGIKITMPALSSTMKEGRVVSWLKSEGDEIEAGEAIMVVESDKADMDVEAFEDGYLAKILTEEGETAEVGAVVALVAAEEGDIAAVAEGGDGGADGAAAPAAAVEEAPAAEASAGAAAPDVEFSQLDMPALSSTMKEGKVVSWLKGEGDSVEAGEAIMVVESDKADMDVEAFEDGYIAAIITDEGEAANVGSPVALIAANEADIPALKAYASSLAGGAPAAPAAAAPAAASPAKAAPKAAANPAASAGGRVVASPLAKKMATEMGVDISTVAGSGPGGRITAGDVQKAASGGGAPAKKAAAPSKPSWTPAAGVVAATPTARALAKKAKIDLATIEGTGEFGRVTADDIKIATGEMKPKRKIAAPGAPAVVELPEGLVPFTGMQRAVSNNMVATMGCPVFRASREIEMDAFNALYRSVKPKGVTVSALLAKAVAKAIEKHPIVNSSFREEGTFFNKDINVAMAVAIDGGLITPVLKYANERDVLELGENWKELVGKAKSGTLSPDEYNSGTFTISNMGMFGVSQFDAILPAGQGGILAVAGTQEHIVPCKQAVLGMKKISKMTVTLTCDHRQIYGADAALFLKTLNDVMMNPQQLM
eukprot:CAMPEP_0181118928 /NCGR_PEP_ID=MMETSP1071-20121207/23336_1 /TAXON_ID=35127 /ORGANISM="Thalassiosira sp., Strain NH16" /LENGTH=658 /DNA_ID=CAMNT_0023203453 /DNA_START=180 /DNA_END=2156 /DNA_ORIENTATION=-